MRVRLSKLTRMRDKVTAATAHSMRECDALSPLEDIFSVDPHACWNLQSPILESINLPIEAISEGFPDLSSSPDSCYHSDRSRASSGDEPLSPDDVTFAELASLPSLNDEMIPEEGCFNRQERRILIDISSSNDFFDPSLCEFILDSQIHPPKDSDLVFEQECVDPNSWTYLDTTPISLMKTDNELMQDSEEVMASRNDLFRPYVSLATPWPAEPQLITHMPPSQVWSIQDQTIPRVLTDEFKFASKSLIFKTPEEASMLTSVSIEPSLSVQVDPKHNITKTKRQGRQRRQDTEERQCHVCGERAGKHSYYGGQVCPSCRAFFRRSVQSMYYESYRCSKNSNCDIGLKTRKNCQSCRFRLCEQAGMRRSWVLADGERKRPSASKGDNLEPVDTHVERNPVQIMASQNDMDKIQDCLEKMTITRNQTEDMNPSAMEEITMMLKEGTRSISEDCRSTLRNVLEQRTRLFALNIPEFIELSSQDQITLLEENKGALIALRVATFFKTEFSWVQQIGLLLGPGDAVRFSQMLSGITLPGAHRLKYENFFSPSASSISQNDPSSEEIDNQINFAQEQLLKKISDWVDDDQMFCLLNLVILFCTDQTSPLRQKSNCEDAQIQFTSLLFRYLNSKHPREIARVKFAEGIMLVSRCRELNNWSSKMRLSANRDPEDELS